MSVHLVVTIIAHDKPGIVEQLSQTIADAGASWLGSRMSRLAGEFAGIVEVSVRDDAEDSLKTALHALESQGMRVQVQSSTPHPATEDEQNQVLQLEFTANDRPGIVREVSKKMNGELAMGRSHPRLSEIERGLLEIATRSSRIHDPAREPGSSLR